MDYYNVAHRNKSNLYDTSRYRQYYSAQNYSQMDKSAPPPHLINNQSIYPEQRGNVSIASLLCTPSDAEAPPHGARNWMPPGYTKNLPTSVPLYFNPDEHQQNNPADQHSYSAPKKVFRSFSMPHYGNMSIHDLIPPPDHEILLVPVIIPYTEAYALDGMVISVSSFKGQSASFVPARLFAPQMTTMPANPSVSQQQELSIPDLRKQSGQTRYDLEMRPVKQHIPQIQSSSEAKMEVLANAAFERNDKNVNEVYMETDDDSSEVRLDRPYACTHEGCTKSFPSKGRLQRHMFVHTGLKPYTCLYQGCKKTFSRRDNMLQHYRAHIISIPSEKLFQL